MKCAYIVGKGEMQVDGKTVNYPVHKLIIQNKKGEEMELKLDKINRKLIGYMFDLTDTNTMVEDENGVQCKLYKVSEITSDEEN